jgi:hypothetical protein
VEEKGEAQATGSLRLCYNFLPPKDDETVTEPPHFRTSFLTLKNYDSQCAAKQRLPQSIHEEISNYVYHNA